MAGIIATPMAGVLGSGGAVPFYPYTIGNSCRFNDNDSAKMVRTFSATPTDRKKFTFSIWAKRCNLGTNQGIWDAYSDGSNFAILSFISTDKLRLYVIDGGVDYGFDTDAVFRDPTSWYHICFVYDSANATGDDRLIVWVNNKRFDVSTDTTSYGTLPQNHESIFLGNLEHDIGLYTDASGYFDGYLAENYLVDGLALAPTDFAESYKGVWRPKDPASVISDYGDDGHYLDFAVAPGTGNGAGTDVSGKANHWTDTNLAAADQVLDTPTENYCVMNTITQTDLREGTFANGNLTVTTAVGGGWSRLLGTIAFPTTGKWYFEAIPTSINSAWVGIVSEQNAEMDAYLNDGKHYQDEADNGAYGATFTNSDVIGVAWDADAKSLTFYKNNASQGAIDLSARYGDNVAIYAAIGDATSSQSTIWDMNFGQLGFTYTPPAGYNALNVSNIAGTNGYNYSTSVLDSDKGFDIITYAGTGAENAQTGLNFSPNIVWIKNRDTTDQHNLVDTVRGATIELNADATSAESTVAQGLKSFDSNGFTLGTDLTYNTNTENYVAWCFKESASYGIDIVSYTGTGAAHAENHSLGAAPELIIIKSRDDAFSWRVYHHAALNKTDPETDYGRLDDSSAWADLNTIWNDTAPTSTQFTVGTSGNVNSNGSNYIGYLFRSIEGFSKVFSYEGNGNADGPFVYLGFRPKMILLKNADTGARNWLLFDDQRNTYNVVDAEINPDATAAESTVTTLDIVSNGFKLRTADGHSNQSANTIIGIAFAAMPGVYGNAR